MKKILALVLVIALLMALAGCTNVTRMEIQEPAAIEVEKEGGGFSVKITDPKTVQRVTDIVCQLPLETAEATEDVWSYRITWLDADGETITAIAIHGAQIAWEGQRYRLGLGVDLSKLTDVLETIPGLNK